jgi:uncharacterized delta-60 repeat protein
LSENAIIRFSYKWKGDKSMKLTVFFCLISMFVSSSSIYALPGELDPTFGRVGFTTTSITTGLDHAHGIVRQSDGKIVLAGNRNEESGSGITLIRYNPNGSLDTTFGTNGIIQGETGQANAVALQPDGKIVITGRIGTLQGTFFAVLRYNTNGTLDTSFSGDGVLTTSDLITGNAIAIQPDGKIVVAGTLITVGSDDFAVVRINTDGTLDTTFDGDGKLSTAVGDPSVNNGNDAAKAVAIQSDGKIVVGGYSPFINTSRDFSLVRYNPNGSLDSTFDGDGILHTPFDNSAQNESLQAITLDANGKIVAVGTADTAVAEQSFALIRYNQDGSPDNTFSGDGKLLIKTRPNTFEEANAVTIQSGKILIAGMSGFSAKDFALVRFNADGTLDQSFGSNGAVYTRISEELDGNLLALTLAPNGDILAGGFAQKNAGGDSFAFAKYSSNGVPSGEFGVFGYVINNFENMPTRSYEAKSVALQTNGMFVVAGNFSTNPDTTSGILARYDTNGNLDRNFNNQAGFIQINSPAADNRELTSVAVQPDGKILALGNYDSSTDIGLFVSRFNSNGSPDLQFGANGQVVIGVLSGGGLGQDMTILADGKILIAGASVNIFTQLAKFTVFKLNANGSRDTSFGSNGISTTSFSSSNDVALSISVQTDGKIVASGSSDFNIGSNSQIALARFNANGSLDTSFGTQGKLTTEIGSFIDLASDTQIQTDGKIVISGVSCTDGGCNGGNGLIFRYNSNGVLDSTFDGDGKVFIQPPTAGSSSGVSSILIKPDNKIIGCGSIINPGTLKDALVVSYNANGSPDSTFGTNGIALSDINSTDQIAYSLALQPDGKILAVGSNMVGTTTDFAVWRFLGNQPQTTSAVKFDFDGDSKTDISIYRPNLGQWWYLRSSDNTNRAFSFGNSTDKIVPADYTGDGKTDIATFTPATGFWNILRSENSTFFGFPFGTTGDIAAPADYDGDGKADAAVFRPSNSTWFISKSSGGTTIQQFGASGDKPVVADYDGDGKADLAIYRVALGQWWYLRSSDGTNRAFQFGTATDKPLQGDYTGDGKADLAFFRPSTGEWFILRSEDSTFYGFPFGANGDIPASGDYDGDGKFDAAVFRPSNTTWYISRSTSGTQIVGFGANGDQPVPNAFVP